MALSRRTVACEFRCAPIAQHESKRLPDETRENKRRAAENKRHAAEERQRQEADEERQRREAELKRLANEQEQKGKQEQQKGKREQEKTDPQSTSFAHRLPTANARAVSTENDSDQFAKRAVKSTKGQER